MIREVSCVLGWEGYVATLFENQISRKGKLEEEVLGSRIWEPRGKEAKTVNISGLNVAKKEKCLDKKAEQRGRGSKWSIWRNIKTQVYKRPRGTVQ